MNGNEKSADKVEIFKDSAGEWRWHRKDARNGEIISQGEGYTKHSEAVHGSLRANPDLTLGDVQDQVDRT